MSTQDFLTLLLTLKQELAPLPVDYHFLMSFDEFWSQEPPILAVHVNRRLGKNYYKKALELVEFETAILFGDPLDMEGNFYWFGTSGSNWTDVQLMSFCDYHIISDSPFSWWGAFLSDDDSVIYPHPGGDYMVPPTWRQVDL